MELESLKSEIEKKKSRSEERYHRYLDNDSDLPCTFTKTDLEEVRKDTYQEVLDMMQKTQEKEIKERNFYKKKNEFTPRDVLNELYLIRQESGDVNELFDFFVSNDVDKLLDYLYENKMERLAEKEKEEDLTF